MGIVVLAVAILPMLGVGGMQLYRAETPGPMKDPKLTPRITETAKALWSHVHRAHGGLRAAYWLAGMSLFDAIATRSTVSTGGFSTHDANLGYFDSTAIEGIAIVFMFLGGVNFSLHFTVLKRRDIGSYWRDPEFRAYFLLLAVVIAFAYFTCFA